MEHRTLGIAIAAAAIMALTAPSIASATTLDGAEGMLSPGTASNAEADGTLTMHVPVGDLTCEESTISGTTSNTGGSSETVEGTIEGLTFRNCNATVAVLKKGTSILHTVESSSTNNGKFTLSGTEVTVLLFGLHCIYSTSSTDLGVVTGSANTGGKATVDIIGTIPRTGGSILCGQSGQVTGSYRITIPSTLNVT